jgi:transcriptional regulator with GAF, ATPase, and Fis domain
LHELPAKLLRVLGAREFEHVRGVAPIPVDARVIIETNDDLERAVRRRR